MPIITFLQDVFSIAKGPYHQKIGRHTQRFCSRAAKHSENEVQKKIFFVAAICADEFVATLLRLKNKKSLDPFEGRILQNKIAKQQIVRVFRVYISALLTLMSSQKERLLEKTGMQEHELLHLWCSIFEYSSFDMQMFNEFMLPVYRQEGIDGLSILLGENALNQLFIVNDVLSPFEIEKLQKIIVEDAAALLRVLQQRRAEAL